jgi:hypothetical protein
MPNTHKKVYFEFSRLEVFLFCVLKQKQWLDYVLSRFSIEKTQGEFQQKKLCIRLFHQLDKAVFTRPIPVVRF